MLNVQVHNQCKNHFHHHYATVKDPRCLIHIKIIMYFQENSVIIILEVNRYLGNRLLLTEVKNDGIFILRK